MRNGVFFLSASLKDKTPDPSLPDSPLPPIQEGLNFTLPGTELSHP